MKTILNNLTMYYEDLGKGTPLILLHGWAGNHDSFFPVTQILKNSYRVIVPDLPGFGASTLPQETWDITKYANHLNNFIQALKLENPVLIGHSFGGTIAAKLTSIYPQSVSKLVLVDAKLFKSKNSLKKIGANTLAKIGKIALKPFDDKLKNSLRKKLYQTINQHDYENLQGTLKENFIKIINESLEKDLEQIKIPTLLVWGEKDQDTPLSDGKKAHTLISKSQLQVISNTAHFSYLENINTFITIVTTFLNS